MINAPVGVGEMSIAAGSGGGEDMARRTASGGAAARRENCMRLLDRIRPGGSGGLG